ncbi:MAG: DUF2779 domain-containing protein [Bacilli bacterium]|nr:DUF2779 domain-containing protein [Bacilli bacterium]
MAISKTDFINYSRCNRYIVLDKIKKEKFDADISLDEYKNQEKKDMIEEMLGSMYDFDGDEEVDLVDVPNKQLEAMMDYYKQVELEAGRLVEKYFKGKTVYSKDTYNQECFDFNRNGVKYLCYVDVYNENDDGINIIEVKATTTNAYKKLGFKNKDKEFVSIFEKFGPMYKLKDEVSNLSQIPDFDFDKYQKQVNKLLDRYGIGKYVYDLSVQRFMIEGEYKSSENLEKLNNIHYYLAVLNADYIFDGKYIDGKAIYDIDENGNEIINFFDLTNITKIMQPKIENDAEKIERILFNPVDVKCDLGKWCGYKKPGGCKYFNAICGKDIPHKNSSLNYISNGQGFDTPEGRIKGLDLINHGYLNMLDVPEEWITRKTHMIQRDCVRFNNVYINKEKLKLGLKQIKYPIYHLDFETFPCPVPRFKGEWPYIQSPFEFSLHIEKEPGVCDKFKDNYVFLAKTHEDEREELVKKLIEYIDPDKGTLFAQNVPFEKGRIKELSNIFPEYKDKLMKIYDRGFDLLWLVNTSTSMYEELGYSEEEAKIFNYYHPDLSGSFSIKKTLPVFSDLTYKDLTVKNGTEAIVEYANYNKMSKEEYNIKYQALVDYCQQDTWAMVVILDELRKLVK